MTLFIGPAGDNGGPAIKNKLLIKYLNIPTMKIYNTAKRTLLNWIMILLKLIFTTERQIIVSVSRNGRNIIYPILLLKKKLHPNLKYIIIYIGGTIINEANRYPTIIKKTLENADLVTVETEGLKNESIRKLKLNNMYYMPNYKELPFFNKESNLGLEFKSVEKKRLNFVFLSSLRNIKGISTLVQAFELLLKDFPETILDIYGPIRPDLDRNVLDDIEKSSNIHYKGTVNNEDVINTLSKYDIFVFPTEADSEGFPAVIIEAYLAGLVVLASDINYNPEIVKNGENGWIFSAGEVQSLYSTLVYCFNNIDELNSLSKNNLVEGKKYDADMIISDFKNKIQRIGWSI